MPSEAVSIRNIRFDGEFVTNDTKEHLIKSVTLPKSVKQIEVVTLVNQTVTSTKDYFLVPNAKKEFSEEVVDFCGKGTKGHYYVTRWFYKLGLTVMEGAKLLGSSLTSLEKPTQLMGNISNFLALSGLIAVAPDAAKNTKKAWKDPNVENLTKAANGLGDTVAYTCYTAMPLFPGSVPLANAAAVASFVADSTASITEVKEHCNLAELKKTVDKASNVTDAEKTESKKDLTALQKYRMMRIIKEVAAAVVGVFSLIAVLAGVTIVPPILLLILGLASTSFALYSHFYNAGLEYHLKDKLEPQIKFA